MLPVGVAPAPLAACTCTGGLPRELGIVAAEELAARTRLKPAEVKALYARFRRLAPAGFLLPEQFRQTLGVLGLSDDHFLPDRLFRVFDSNQDGQLCFDEFATSLAVMLRGTEDEKLRLSFQMASDRQGGISFEDFRHLIHTCSAMKSNLIAPTAGMPSEEDIQRLFRDVAGAAGEDPMEVGFITLEAYKSAVHSNSEFLDCLGLSVRPPNSSLDPGASELLRRRSWSSPPTEPPVSAVGSGARSEGVRSEGLRSEGVQTEGPYIQAGHLEELLGHADRLREALQVEGLGKTAQQGDLVEEECNVELGEVTEDELPPAPSRKGQRRGTEREVHGPAAGAGPAVLSFAEMARAAQRLIEGAWKALPSCKPQCGEPSEHEVDVRVRAEKESYAVYEGVPGNENNVPPTSPKPPTLLGGAVQAEVNHLLTWCQRHGRCGALGAGGKCREASVLPSAPGAGSASPRPGARGATQSDGEDARNTPRRSSIRSNLSKRPSFVVQRSGEDLGHKVGRRKSKAYQHRLRLHGPKKGLAVHFGHENWNMVLSMMIGIRMSIGRCRHEIPRELTAVDFVMKEKFSIIPRLTNIFDSAASQRITMTRFIDFAPMVFHRIRQTFGIQHDDYLRSVGPEQLLGNMVLGNLSSLAELSSEGKSGAFFYYTADGRYMMKTVAQKEYRLLRGMLNRYYQHIMDNPGTLIVRFLGLHCLSMRERRRGSKGATHSVQKLYFVVMANMFNTPFEIHRRYDLKGSWVGRFTPHDQREQTVAMKDVDFTEAKEKVCVGEEAREALLAQLENDSSFLRDNGIIDYSLLLGVHDVEDTDRIVRYTDPSALVSFPSNPAIEWHRNAHSPASCSPAGSPGASPSTRFANHTSYSHHTCFPGEALTRVALPLHQRDSGGLLSSDRESLYYFGIIDILTPYDSAKKLEHNIKALVYDSKGVSCCEPGFYAERFMAFMRKALI